MNSNTFCFVLFSILSIASALAQGPQIATTPESNSSYLQILNRAEIEKLNISLDDKLIIKDLASGARLNAIPVEPGNKKILFADQSGPAQKEFPVSIEPKTHYSVIVWGDFAEIPNTAQEESSQKKIYNVRFFQQANEKIQNGKIRVTLANLAQDKTIRIAHEEKLIATVPPNTVQSVKNLPVNLFLAASDQKRIFNLYLSQDEEPDPKNLIIMFWEENGETKYRAVTEKLSVLESAG
jgi:hypothetical protein